MASASNMTVPPFCRFPITGTVGLLGDNHPSDVNQIRQMLCRICYVLKLSGRGPMGMMTVDTPVHEFIPAIIDFVRRFCNLEHPDGLIRPNHITYNQLYYMVTSHDWIAKLPSISIPERSTWYYDWKVNSGYRNSVIPPSAPHQILDRDKDKPTVIDFAQLAIDAYNNPDDDIYRKDFNKFWVKAEQCPNNSWGMAKDIGKPPTADEDPKTGFYANFYLNTLTNVGVMAIRGTDSFLDQLVDANYLSNKLIQQYEQALKYFQSLQKKYPSVNRFYVCGHSLGGIVAKMIFPVTKVNTIAFNSPGVVQYLKTNKKPYIKAPNSDAMCIPMIEPMAITFCANGDPIGNLRHDNDVGTYIWLPVLSEERIPDKSDRIGPKNLLKGLLDALNGIFDVNMSEFETGVNEIPEFDKAAYFARLIKYHGMADLYTALNQSSYKNDRI